MTKEEEAADDYARKKEPTLFYSHNRQKESFLAGIKHRDENPKPIGPWIDIEALPPPKGHEVLGGWYTDKGFEKGLGIWTGKDFIDDDLHILRATHWTPIPLEEPK